MHDAFAGSRPAIGIIACASAHSPASALSTPSGSPARIAVVHDWLDTWRGGENVLAAVLDLYPDADLFALVDFLPDALRARIGGRRATTSFLQRMPGARAHFRKLLPLFPRAIASLDVSSYDTIISISHAVAKGVRVREGQRHLCYCLTPMRYAWDLRDQYFPRGSAAARLRPVADRVLDRLRDWDREASRGVDQFAAISNFIAQRIARAYGRPAQVIYPPVDTAFFRPGDMPPTRDFHFTASRWVAYKRIDAIVAAFAQMPTRRLVVAGDGPDAARVRALAGTNVQFVGEVPRERLRELMRNAQSFLFAAEEDFGIVPLEAQACGTPVIAYARGGALETIVAEGPQPTGVFFHAQTPAAIADAVAALDASAGRIDGADCRRNAERFGLPRFARDFAAFVGIPAGQNASGTR
jgi:glycosyltransferase involved in cell wall biosynthesis